MNWVCWVYWASLFLICQEARAILLMGLLIIQYPFVGAVVGWVVFVLFPPNNEDIPKLPAFEFTLTNPNESEVIPLSLV